MSPILPAGARIAVIAPASRFDFDLLNRGLATLADWGFQPELFDGALDPVRNLAASDAVRLEHWVRAFSDPRYDAVWAVRGGYGFTRIMQSIPWAALTAKPLIGFSDLTPALDLATQRLGAIAIHGPVVHSLPSTDAASLSWLRDLLAGAPLPALRGDVWVPGSASGPVVGGNLCLVAATCGTSAQLDATGCLLVLEEVGEPAYRIDRMLQQLASAGVLHGVAGVLVGSFTGCAAPEDQGWSVDDVLRDHLAGLGCPVLAGLPIGHGPANRAFVVRRPAHLADGVLKWR